MANLSDVLNTLSCTAGDVIGGGTAHCKFDFKNMSGGGIGFLKPRTAIPAVLTQQALIGLQLAGNLNVLKGIFSVEDQSSDDQFDTSESGIEVLGTKGLMKYRVNFTNGVMFNRALASLESNRQYETILWDAAGSVLLRQDAQGNARGYSTGQITIARPTMASGGTAAKQSLVFQWININEFNNNVAYLDAETLAEDGISFLELDGANELKITLNAPAPGTTITGKIVSAFDNTLVDDTLLAADFLVNGVAPTAATIAADGTFSLTVSAFVADDVLNVSLNGIVANQDNVLYKSNTAKVVATA